MPTFGGVTGILQVHLGQAPGLGHGFPDDGDSGRGQPGVLGANVADLDPDAGRLALCRTRPAG